MHGYTIHSTSNEWTVIRKEGSSLEIFTSLSHRPFHCPFHILCRVTAFDVYICGQCEAEWIRCSKIEKESRLFVIPILVRGWSVYHRKGYKHRAATKWHRICTWQCISCKSYTNRTLIITQSCEKFNFIPKSI